MQPCAQERRPGRRAKMRVFDLVLAQRQTGNINNLLTKSIASDSV